MFTHCMCTTSSHLHLNQNDYYLYTANVTVWSHTASIKKWQNKFYQHFFARRSARRTIIAWCQVACLRLQWPSGLRKFLPAYLAPAPSSSSIRKSWLYFASRSLRHGAPVLICLTRQSKYLQTTNIQSFCMLPQMDHGSEKNVARVRFSCTVIATGRPIVYLW